MDWKGIWNSIVDFFTTNVWKIVGFFAVLVIGFIVVKIVMNIIRKILGRSKMDKIAQQFLCAIIKFLLYFILVLVLLSVIGIQITGILTALSAVILAVGMALESNIANLANGIVIVSTKMFKRGDYIIVNGVEGSIDSINFLFVTINTVDNKRVTIPNSTIVNSEVSNAGANPKRRVDFTFSVAYETDVETVKKIVTDVMKSDGRIYLDPAPFCRLKTLNSSSIDFFCNCWCDNSDYWDVYYNIVERVYNEFKRNNISVPYTQLEVRNRNDKVVMPYDKAKLPERVEKVRDEKHQKLDLETASFSDLVKHKHKDETDTKENKKEKNEKKKKTSKEAK